MNKYIESTWYVHMVYTWGTYGVHMNVEEMLKKY